MKKELIIQLTASLIIVLFLYTGLTKSMNNGVFERALLQAPLVKFHAVILARLLPAIEIVIAVLVAYKRTRLSGFIGAAFLLFLFTLYLLYMINSGEKLPCNCGGIINQLGWKEHVLLNILFLATAVTGAVTYTRTR